MRVALVVDDHEDTRVLVDLLLSPHFEVISVVDGPQALRVAAELKPELVILDYMMPNMSGPEVARAIMTLRARETGRLKIVALSAVDENASEWDWADAFLPKDRIQELPSLASSLLAS